MTEFFFTILHAYLLPQNRDVHSIWKVWLPLCQYQNPFIGLTHVPLLEPYRGWPKNFIWQPQTGFYKVENTCAMTWSIIQYNLYFTHNYYVQIQWEQYFENYMVTIHWAIHTMIIIKDHSRGRLCIAYTANGLCKFKVDTGVPNHALLTNYIC